jgi:WhiB family redox-sensing transcriptional regulator
MSAYECLVDGCKVPAVTRGMCGRHYTRVMRGADAAPAGAERAPSAAWMAEAVCREVDPEVFFPVGSTGPAAQQIAEAKFVCHQCPVRAECLSWALATGQDSGVWGGMSEDERRALKTGARTAAAQLETVGGAR